MIKFYKVSYEQFKKDFPSCYDEEFIRDCYNKIKLPERATTGSAGYDFFAPFDIRLSPNITCTFPTGIRCEMDSNVVLMLYPRSGKGFKYRLALNNTVGVIDSDYFFANNDGHIMVKMNYTENDIPSMYIKQGEGFMQGIFINYLTTDDDNATGVRVGGFGSTSK